MRSKRHHPQDRKRCQRACDTCKRRKERCNGVQPCGRCLERGVDDRCCFEVDHGQHPSYSQESIKKKRPSPSISQPSAPFTDVNWAQAQSPATLENSRLLLDKKGRVMFIGDTANPSFLQVIRCLVRDCQGHCAFVDDPLRVTYVEAEGGSKWLDVSSAPTISADRAKQFAQQYYLATNGVMDLFDKSVIVDMLPLAVSRNTLALPLAKPIVYLVLAIGAQCVADDGVAEECFSYGRYLTARYLMEDATKMTVQAYLLIAMYLLGACRRNAAFMHLGFAVRSAYALGLHLSSVSLSFPEEECKIRERMWRAVRSMDLFTSASLGRPPSTSETRETRTKEGYSASNDLCDILENILTSIYGRRRITTAIVNNIGLRQRLWAASFGRGLANDNIGLGSRIVDGDGDGQLPNIGLMHIKQTYYWTIMLLTRPFLIARVTIHARAVAANPDSRLQPCTAMDSSRTLVHACIDSAIRTIALLEPLLDSPGIPKRLPFIIASIVHSALVLGLACFGDMSPIFPLQKYLQTAHRLLLEFPSDAIASRNAMIIHYMQDACLSYFEKRHRSSMDVEGRAIHDLFGQIHQPVSGEAADEASTLGFVGQEAVASGHESTSHFAKECMSGSATSSPSAHSAMDPKPSTLATDTVGAAMPLSTEGSVDRFGDQSTPSGIDDLDISFMGSPQILCFSQNDLNSLFAPVDVDDCPPAS